MKHQSLVSALRLALNLIKIRRHSRAPSKVLSLAQFKERQISDLNTYEFYIILYAKFSH